MLDDLFTRARAARENAYAPYSDYRVGAALRGASGLVFSGCNVENAAYPVGTCAEAGAIAAMVAAGERLILDILVVGDGKRLIAPCGACLQRIAEFAGPLTNVHLANPTRICESYPLSALFPHVFAGDRLEPNRPPTEDRK